MDNVTKQTVDACNKAGIEIMEAVYNDKAFDFGCFIGADPEKLEKILSTYPENILQTDKSFSMCCLNALISGAKKLWDFGTGKEDMINRVLIDDAFDRLYEEMKSYTHKVQNLKWTMDNTSDEEVQRVLKKIFDDRMKPVTKDLEYSEKAVYNDNFRIRPGEKWGMMQRLGGDPEYLLHEKYGAIAGRHVTMFDIQFNLLWDDKPENMPSQQVVDTCVELVAKLLPRTFLQVKYFFRRHTDMNKPQQLYIGELASFDRSRRLSEPAYTNGLNKVWKNVSFAKSYPYEYEFLYERDIYSTYFKRTPWEKETELQIKAKMLKEKQQFNIKYRVVPLLSPVLIFIAFLLMRLRLTGALGTILFYGPFFGSLILTYMGVYGFKKEAEVKTRLLWAVGAWVVQLIAIVIIMGIFKILPGQPS